MHRITTLLSLILLAFAASAAPVDRQTALTVGTHFLQRQGLIKSTDQLTPYDLPNTVDADKCLYIFNLDTTGFVIVSADDRSYPILGYSMNGGFDIEKAPTNMLAWLRECASTIREGINANSPENKYTLKLWTELLLQPEDIPSSPKSDTYLLTSTWEQGSGYNN